ncbi:Hypothetical predicted protein [Pelobates cultripes]|uniref:Uncharacterized protein n=1 Tax=Pelobates cultripes TaxID=61616 RepID=A0AAD1W9W6_PELCU|nr:Hypothetical predicted protein [Pelobates cultripes]
MLLIDRVHRLPRPRFLPETAPRDVLMRIHYYHIKEHVLRVSRIKVKPPADFPEIKIFAELLASTLRRRKDFSQIANTLRSNGIRFRWGFPTKMLLTKDGFHTSYHITGGRDKKIAPLGTHRKRTGTAGFTTLSFAA